MKSVVICGSKRFRPEIRKFASNLKKSGVVVFEPNLHEGGGEWAKLSPDYKKYISMGLTYDHFQKIRMADVVYLFNKNGYCGVSCTLEIGYAVALGKAIYVFSEKDEEHARKVLYRETIKTPKELIKKLK
jgi:nucleoside 2-deoxyribosyltransferase